MTNAPLSWGEADNGGGCALWRQRARREVSLPSSQFCCEPKTAPIKIKSLKMYSIQYIGFKR